MLHKYYNWNQLIDTADQMQLKNDVEHNIFTLKNFWSNSPKYQTNYNVFATPGPCWNNLKMSFIWSCFAFNNKEVKIQTIQSWAYATSLEFPEERNNLWHHHNHNPKTTTISGIYYLSPPDDIVDLKDIGTEFAPNGLNNNNRYFADWKTGHWLIYPGHLWHRPGILKSKKFRYVIAADMEF